MMLTLLYFIILVSEYLPNRGGGLFRLGVGFQRRLQPAEENPSSVAPRRTGHMRPTHAQLAVQ